MSISEKAVSKKVLTTFTTIVVMVAGALTYFNLGQLEDPEFTVKTAFVATAYPGASPKEVELEVTEVIERAVQEMAEVKEIESTSTAGFSSVKVIIKPSYRSGELPQIWDVLRKRVADAVASLPPGAGAPLVIDNFGDVYGFLFSLQSDGFSLAELERYADDIKRELALVPGVAKVVLWGVQPQCVYLEVSEARLSQLEMTPADFHASVAQQNTVISAGTMDVQGVRARFQVGGEFTSTDEIGDLVIRAGRPGAAQADRGLIRVRDVAIVRRGYLEPARNKMRHNGRPSIAIAVTNVSGANIVKMGQAIDERLETIVADLPIGIEIERISWQSDQVSIAIRSFMVSLAQAVAIVLGVLWLAMGLRSSIVVGLTGLVMVIVATFLVMGIVGEDLHRMSLGALIIAMGMMVDNAIVVADGVHTRMQKGMDRIKAAIEAASQPAMPLLGATVVAAMAFYPIAASKEGAGEYCAALFTIAGISLLISWVFAVTIAPIICAAVLPAPKADAKDPYGGALFHSFRTLLRGALRFRYVVAIGFAGCLVASLLAFRWVDSMFFPAAARPQFMVDLWLPQGTDLERTSSVLRELETKVGQLDGVTSFSAFIGQGPPRFYLPVDPESQNSSYAQLIVNTVDARTVDRLLPTLQEWADQNIADGIVITRKYGLGPYKSWPVDVKFSGPASADPRTLRALASQALETLASDPNTRAARLNWRERTPRTVAYYDQANARWTGISRGDIGAALQRAYDGFPVGLYRERDKLLPIIVRNSDEDRAELARNLDLLQIRASFADRSVPLSQVTTSLETDWEDPIIYRFNRKRTIAAQAVPAGLATDLLDSVKDRIDAIELPPGYSMFWDGEYRSSGEARRSLVPGIVPALVIMAITIVALFNAYRQPLIIALVVPFSLIGVVVGLLATGQPFGFVALLGAMSLAGMMIKNAIVLLDEILQLKREGQPDYDAVINATVSRLRPVLLAAGTTVLGVIPLLTDVFWRSMAVVIMFGLTLGTVITLLLVPVLYAIVFAVKAPDAALRK